MDRLDGRRDLRVAQRHPGAVPSSRTCEWYHVRDGRIASVSVIFDARPFAAMFGGQHGGG